MVYGSKIVNGTKLILHCISVIYSYPLVAFDLFTTRISFAPNIASGHRFASKKWLFRGGSHDAILEPQFDHDQSTVGTLYLLYGMNFYLRLDHFDHETNPQIKLSKHSKY